jgi:hypothetical protein
MSSSWIQELREMKTAMEEGLVTQEEYDVTKNAILGSIRNKCSRSNPTSSELVLQPEKQGGSKLYLIVKPEQAGKTMEVLQRMVGAHRTNHTISIIFCDNSLLQVSQTKARAGVMRGLGKICEISSSKDSDARSANDLYCLFDENEDEYTTIACCAHSTQIHVNINDFLNKMARRVPLQKFEIYFDEASKVAVSDKMSAKVREWEHLSNVEKIYFIDATPESKEGGLLSVYADVTPLNLCYPKGPLSANYIGVADFDWVVSKPRSGENSVGYAKRILDVDPLKAGDYAFIPAGFKRASHYDMRDMLVEKNALVVVLNGELKGLSIKHKVGGVTTSTEFDQIQSSSINDIIEKEAWLLAKKLNKPLVITGGVVPGRGLSFQKEGMLFTRGIFGPNVATNAKDRSQKAGRLKGNIRHFPGYAPCKVHSSKAFHDECVLQEEFGRWLQQEALKGEEGEETKMDQYTAQQELERRMVEMGMKNKDRGEPTIEKFYGDEGQAEGKKWYDDKLHSVFRGRGPNIRVKKEDGMYHTTIRTMGNRAYSTLELDAEKRFGLGKNEKFRFHPCYADVSDSRTLQWWLIYYK